MTKTINELRYFIDEEHGSISIGNEILTFELIEELHRKTHPLLAKRKKLGLIEGAVSNA